MSSFNHKSKDLISEISHEKRYDCRVVFTSFWRRKPVRFPMIAEGLWAKSCAALVWCPGVSVRSSYVRLSSCTTHVSSLQPHGYSSSLATGYQVRPLYVSHTTQCFEMGLRRQTEEKTIGKSECFPCWFLHISVFISGSSFYAFRIHCRPFPHGCISLTWAMQNSTERLPWIIFSISLLLIS